MVAEMVGTELGRPVAVDADPKHVVALGAARVAARERVAVGAAPAVGTPAVVPPAPQEASPPVAPPFERTTAAEGVPSTTPTEPVAVAPARAREATAAREGARSRRWLFVAAAAVAVVLLGAGALVLASGDGDGGGGFVSQCPPEGEPAVCITDVSFAGEELAIDFTDHDVDLGDEFVPIFFLTDVTESGAGSVTNRTSDWRDWGPTSPMQGTNAAGHSGWTAAEIAGSQTSVCVLVGDPNGRVAAGTGNCAELPARP
jgi:hypothetical protein